VVTSAASSEYETDSDDDSWCSEDMSAEDNQRMEEDTRLQEAALEALRQRDMFAKVLKRSYSKGYLPPYSIPILLSFPLAIHIRLVHHHRILRVYMDGMALILHR
jgi:hypothetical protein